MKKRTIGKEVSISGKGLHSGKEITLRLKPSESGQIRFIRTDVGSETVIVSDVAYIIDTTRSTTLGSGEVKIATVEHLLAALAGKMIYSIDIEVNGPEIPILDGSARPFSTALNDAGIVELDSDMEFFEVKEVLTLKDDATGSEFIALPSDRFELQCHIDFPNHFVSEQSASLKNLDDFDREIAPCRTFVFTNELEELFNQGLIKGGDLDNAIVVAEPGLDQQKLNDLSKKFSVEGLNVNSAGIYSREPLYFSNEMARHKLLDVMGDLCVLGRPIKGKIIAIKPGHKINTEFTQLLKHKLVEQKRLKGKPDYDPNQEVIKNVEEIKSMLPHRYPFLMVDKIIELSDTHVVGVKNVTFNEGLFQGHFPGNPIFPGVLQMEALAQTGGILALSTVEDPHLWDTYFLKMEAVKFKNKVVPGDTLLLKMELLSPIRRGIVHMQGRAYVGDKLVSEGELTAQIIKRTSE